MSLIHHKQPFLLNECKNHLERQVLHCSERNVFLNFVKFDPLVVMYSFLFIMIYIF